MLNSNALTTVARLSDYLGIDTPAVGSATERKLEAYINSVSNFIARYTGFTFKKTTYTNEIYTVDAGPTLNLKHYPVLSSEPFNIDRRNSLLNESSWESIDGEVYDIDWESGIVSGMSDMMFARGQSLYRVSYTAGYDFDNSSTFLGDTLAGDVETAVWLIAQDLYNNSGVSANVKQESLGDYSVTYGGVQKTMFQNMDALSILDYWKDLQAGGPLTPSQ